MRKRKLVAVPLGVVAVLLTFVSMAWACTVIKGTTNTTTTSATKNDPITASGSGAQATYETWTGKSGPVTYYLSFLNFSTSSDGHSCMGKAGQNRIAASGRTASPTGAIASITGTIPSGALPTTRKTGPALVCFISGTSSAPDYYYGTNAAQVTIT